MKNNRLASYIILLLMIVSFSSCSPKKSKMPPGKAIERLIKGNERYVNNASEHLNRNEERRKKLFSKQYPYAVIVGCSDSRVSPEIIFDEGLGDLFVVRVAGNVIGPIELDSIEYSALYLNSAVILVLGHENCGAVSAVIEKTTKDIETIAELIEPAVEKAREDKTDNLLEKATKINALNMKRFLEKSPELNQLVQEQKIEIYAGYYNLKTGRVELINEKDFLKK